MSLILKNGTYISHDTLTFTQKDVVVKEDTDVITLENDYKPMPGDTIVDCTNKYIMHSFADAYMRPCLSLAASSKLYFGIADGSINWFANLINNVALIIS